MNDHSALDTTPQPVKLRIEDYLALEATGAFDHYAKTELLDGEIFSMNAQHRPHAFYKSELVYRLRQALEAIGSDLYVMSEASVTMPDFSLPEPDVILTSEPRGEGFIPLASVALLVEVADTTLKSDLGRKAPLYAEAGVAEYWVVDLPNRKVRQFWGPSGDSYAEESAQSFGERLDAKTLPIAIILPE